MINELIEKEIEKLFGNFDCEPRIIKDLNRDDVELSLQTIAKEVAIIFKEYPDFITNTEENDGYNECVQRKNDLANQIINEVSE